MARTVSCTITPAATQPALPEVPHFVVSLIPPSGVTAPPLQSFSTLPSTVTFTGVPDGTTGWQAQIATKGASNNDLIPAVKSALFNVPAQQTYQVAGTITVTLV